MCSQMKKSPSQSGRTRLRATDCPAIADADRPAMPLVADFFAGDLTGTATSAKVRVSASDVDIDTPTPMHSETHKTTHDTT